MTLNQLTMRTIEAKNGVCIDQKHDWKETITKGKVYW